MQPRTVVDLGLDSGFSWGYNTRPFVPRASEQDFVFVDYPAARSSRPFATEMQAFAARVLAAASAANARLIFVPKNNWQSRLILRLFQSRGHTLFPPKAEAERARDVTSGALGDPMLDRALALAAAAQGQHVIFPFAELRIINASFDLGAKKTIDEPYFILHDHERFTRFWDALLKMGAKGSVNFLKSDRALMRSYFNAPEILSWLALPEPGRHNYEAESRVFETLARTLPSPPGEDEYVDWGESFWAPTPDKEPMGSGFRLRTHAAPLDLFLSRTFGATPKINRLTARAFRWNSTDPGAAVGEDVERVKEEVKFPGITLEECTADEWRAASQPLWDQYAGGPIYDHANTLYCHQFFGRHAYLQLKKTYYRLVQEGEAVGWVSWYNSAPSVARPRIFTVRPDRRGRGLGQLLHKMSSDAFCDEETRKVLLFSTGQGASMYAKQGFHRIEGMSERRVSERVSLVVMEKRL